MANDVFISYAWSDGKDAAETVFSFLSRERILADFDRPNPARLGKLSEQLKARIREARVFLPVLTTDYFTSETAQLEERFAREIEKPFVPVIVGERDWVELPPRYSDEVLIVISPVETKRKLAIDQLVRATSPAEYIIGRVKQVAATGDMNAALTLLEQLKNEVRLREAYRLQVEQYKADLLRISGNRNGAKALIDELRVDADYPYPILQKTLVTSALLRIDEQKWAEARLRLAEAMAILSREDAWTKDPDERRRLLAEVTREMARTYLSEALHDDQPEDVCYELEIAWSLYLEALALVTVEEDRLCHAWVHENLGVLAMRYAKHSRPHANGDGAQEVRNLDYPFIARFRGNPPRLLEVSRSRLDDALALFEDVDDPALKREGKAWAHFHLVQNKLSHGASEQTYRDAERELVRIAGMFQGIPEGEGLVFEELFETAEKLGQKQPAKDYLDRAIQALERSGAHGRKIAELREKLRQLEV